MDIACLPAKVLKSTRGTSGASIWEVALAPRDCDSESMPVDTEVCVEAGGIVAISLVWSDAESDIEFSDPGMTFSVSLDGFDFLFAEDLPRALSETATLLPDVPLPSATVPAFWRFCALDDASPDQMVAMHKNHTHAPKIKQIEIMTN